MRRKESAEEPKYKSRLFNSCHNWFHNHGMQMLAVGFLVAAVGLGTIQAQTVYGDNLNQYGNNGSATSAEYNSTKVNNYPPFPIEPGIIGVSIESYDLNKVGETGLKYLGDSAMKYGSTQEQARKKADALNGKYYRWIKTGEKDGENIYKYANVAHHKITANTLSFQTSKSFDNSTILYVPKATSDGIKKLGLNMMEKGVVIRNGKVKTGYNVEKKELQHDYTTLYSSKDQTFDQVEASFAKNVGTGVYYAKLKKYVIGQSKTKNKTEGLKLKNGDGTKKGGGDGKMYTATDYELIAGLTQKQLNTIVADKKLQAKAKKVLASICGIRETKSHSFVTYPELASTFCLSTTAKALNKKQYQTKMFSTNGKDELISGPNNKDSDIADAKVIRNLFSNDTTLNDRRAGKNKDKVKSLSQLQKNVLNNEYNMHFLDLLVCGYSVAKSTGDTACANAWWNQIKQYVKNAKSNISTQYNVILRLDAGMAMSKNGTPYYASVGSVLNAYYGITNVQSFVFDKAKNQKSINKGFIGFAGADESKKENYQSPNLEVATSKGVVTKKSLEKAGYTHFYKRLENAIKANGKTTSEHKNEWYSRTVVSRAITGAYNYNAKTKSLSLGAKNKLNMVQILKMSAIKQSGALNGTSSSDTSGYSYGTYAIDSYNWKYMDQDDLDLDFKLTILSSAASKTKVKSDGSNITAVYQKYSEDGEAKNTTIKDDLYVKLSTTGTKDADQTVKNFKALCNDDNYCVKIVFTDSTDKTTKQKVGAKKTYKVIDASEVVNGKKVTHKAEQVKAYAADFNKYDAVNKQEDGDKQNYNKFASAKATGGKTAINNKSLIWRISNKSSREKGYSFSGVGAKYVSWKAKVYIYKKEVEGKTVTWTNLKNSSQTVKGKTIKTLPSGADYYETNTVIAEYLYGYNPPDSSEEKEVNLHDTYTSVPQAYAELKEGSIYNETFEAMAGVPSTRTLYYATGGSEFIVQMQAVYDDFRASSEKDYKSTRKYKSVFGKTDCEYKPGDTLKSLSAGQTKTENFVSDSNDKKNKKSVTAEKNSAVNPTGASSYNTSVKEHTSVTKFEATWTGTIGNSTPEPADVGKFNPGKPGSPCAGNGFNPGTQRTKGTAKTNWNVDAYNTALDQAFSWAKQMETIGKSADGTVYRIDDSDGYKRVYHVGDAKITVTMSGGSKSNSIECGSSASFSKNGTYTSSQKSSATVKSNDSGVLGSGYSYTKGQLGKGSGYHAGAHGHGGSCPGNDKQTGTDADGKPIMGPCGDKHNCGTFTAGTDITYGPSASISYTIKVTFDNGKITAENYDGNVGESGLTVSTQTGLTQFGAHTMCGACCQHELPQIVDTWTQKMRFDTIRFTNLKVWKLESGYVEGISEIRKTDDGGGTGIEDGKEAEEIKKEKEKDTEKDNVQDFINYDTESAVDDNGAQYDEDGDLILPDIKIDDEPEEDITVDENEFGDDTVDDDLDHVRSDIVRYDPNIFYNIAQANTSKAGRIRYSLQTGQDDDVTWTEFGNGTEKKRTDFCDGQTAAHAGSPVRVTANGHKKSWCKGCLYSNDTYANDRNHHDNPTKDGEKGTVAATKTKYTNNTSDKADQNSLEWKRFDTRRKQNVTATVISDFLILQTSSGNQSILYYEDKVTSKHNEAQENFKDDLWYSKPQDMKNLKKQDVTRALNMWNDKMWTNNPLRQKSTSLNVGGYNGNYSSTTTKFKGTGNGQTIKTAFDNDEEKYNNIKDELGKAEVKSARKIQTAAEQNANAMNMTAGDITRNLCSPGSGNVCKGGESNGLSYDTNATGSARMGTNHGDIYVAPTKDVYTKAYGGAWNNRVPNPSGAQFGNAGLVLLKDGIVQNPTNTNKEYVTGQSYAFYLPILTYNNLEADDHHTMHDIDDFSYDYEDENDAYLGKFGYTMPSIYTNGQYKINNIVVHSPVSVQYAFVVGADKALDQRIFDADKTGAADLNKETFDSEKCPGTAVDCQFRILNCKYAQLIRKAAFSMDNASRSPVDSEDETNTKTYDSIISSIMSNGGNYSEISLEGSGFTLKRYDGKEAFEDVSDNDETKPNRYISSNKEASLAFSWDLLGIDSSVKTDRYELAAKFKFNELANTTPVFTTAATQLSVTTDGKLQLTLANGDVYTSTEKYITVGKDHEIKYDFGFDSVTMNKSSITVKGVEYALGINTKAYVDDKAVTFTKTASGSEDMSVFAGSGFWLGNGDNTSYVCNYDVDNLAVTRLPGSTDHTAACFKGYDQHSEASQNYYNGVSDECVKTATSEKVEKTFEYTGKVQSIKLQPGTYTLEAWGAQGGAGCSNGTTAQNGGLGGYAKGTITLTQEKTLYVVVGGAGSGPSNHSAMAGGYNGGGSTISDDSDCDDGGGSGGGASHIALSSGILSSLSTRKDDILIVAGGGGGSGFNSAHSEGRAGAGGGTTGGGTVGATGATQTTGYAFGQGGSGSMYSGGVSGGGGGGYYGGFAGSAGTVGCGSGGAGGSGYIGGVDNGSMESGKRSGNGLIKITGTSKAKATGYIDWTAQHDKGLDAQRGENNTHVHSSKCLATASDGLKIAVQEASDGDTSDLEKMLGTTIWNKVKGDLKKCYGGSGSGSSDVAAGKVYTYDYSGSVQNVTLPAGKYKLETWGASGGGRVPGQGGYATGTITIDNDTTLYICVGQKAGTYNGGGTGNHGYGGGATHIATANGVLSSLSSQKDSILLVAGGGAGGSRGAGGAGGGANMSGTNGGSGCGTLGTGATVSSPGSGGYSGSFGKAGGGGWNSCGGGGGYYGGGGSYENYSRDDDDDAGGGGGSGYAAPSLTDVTGTTGGHSGNGLAKITVLETHTDYDPDKVLDLIKTAIGNDFSKISTYITTDGHTIVNPIWVCKNKFDKHVCNDECYTKANGKIKYELSCDEPHHEGNHYDISNEICYEACHDDEAHKKANNHTAATDKNGKALKAGDFILLDNYFQVYYPCLGDFAQTNDHGILNTEQNRGIGYVDHMDTSEWTREKWIKFPYNVLYNRNGVWEEHPAGEWFQVEIFDADGATPKTTYDFYCQLNNNEMSAGTVEFAIEAINDPVSPYGSTNPYGRDADIALDCSQTNDSMTNRDRNADLTAAHSVYRQSFIDVVGRIGNLLLEDTGDMRFSNFFKKSLDDWEIDGIIHKVDKKIQNMYMSWHKNDGDTAVDVRGQKVSPKNEWYNTYTTAKWTDKGEAKDKVVPTPLAAFRNTVKSMQSEELKFGYNLLWDITTIGDYYGGKLQIEPKYYALDTKTGEVIPVDVYLNSDEETKVVNYFGLMDEYGTKRYDTLADKVYDYIMNLNWKEEASQRNYSAAEQKETTEMSQALGRAVLKDDGTPLTKKDPTTGLETTVRQPMEIPYGENYRLGNLQFLYLGDRAKTFIGNSKVTALHNDINGSNDQELFKEFSTIGQDEGKNDVSEDMYYYHAQRWHSTLGLPSSVRFTDARDKDGDGLADHVDPYDTIVFDGKTMYAWEQFDSERYPGRYVYLETATITALGDVYNLRYSQGKDNGVFKVGNKTYVFGDEIPTLLAIYGDGKQATSTQDYDIIQTH